jgi:hypothetical protein
VLIVVVVVPVFAQRIDDTKVAKGVVSCEKRNWPYSDPVCDGYALAMAHQFYQEHPEYFEPAKTAPVVAPLPKTAEATVDWTVPIAQVAAWREQASFTDMITRDGHYVATLDDPNNEWRCGILENGQDPSALTIVCIKSAKPMNDERVKPAQPPVSTEKK